MSTLHFQLHAALTAAFVCGGIGQAAAYPLSIALPSHAVTAPLVSAAGVSLLLGQWHDGSCLLLPPGITPFETATDTLTFRADGTFAQVIQKATGTLQARGRYTVTGSRLTLDYLFGTQKPAQYDLSRTGDILLLQSVSGGKTVVRTLVRVSAAR